MTPDPNSPKDNLGLATGFIQGSAFGNPAKLADNPIPREFRFSLGFRF